MITIQIFGSLLGFYLKKNNLLDLGFLVNIKFKKFVKLLFIFKT